MTAKASRIFQEEGRDGCGVIVPSYESAKTPKSVKTYRYFAEQKYCEEQSLIPSDEQNQVFAALE
jgi:hypothetical protein